MKEAEDSLDLRNQKWGKVGFGKVEPRWSVWWCGVTVTVVFTGDVVVASGDGVFVRRKWCVAVDGGVR